MKKDTSCRLGRYEIIEKIKALQFGNYSKIGFLSFYYDMVFKVLVNQTRKLSAGD
jgi:hypothetical protein